MTRFTPTVASMSATTFAEIGTRARHLRAAVDHHFAVGKTSDDGAPEADVQVLAHGLRELGIGVAGEDAHALKRHDRKSLGGKLSGLAECK